MKRKQFQELALLFIAANSKFSSSADWAWTNTLSEKVKAITELAAKLHLLDDDEPDKPP